MFYQNMRFNQIHAFHYEKRPKIVKKSQNTTGSNV